MSATLPPRPTSPSPSCAITTSSSSLPLPPSSSAEQTASSSQQTDVQVIARPRIPSTESSAMRSRKREIIALDGFMFDSSVLQDPDDANDNRAQDNDCSNNDNNGITPDTASAPSDRKEPGGTPSGNSSLSPGASSLSSDPHERSLRALHRNNAADALAGNTRPPQTPLTVDSISSNNHSTDNSNTNGSQAQQVISPSSRTTHNAPVATIIQDTEVNEATSGGQQNQYAGVEQRNKTLSTSSVSSSSSSTDESSSASSPTDSPVSPMLEDDSSSLPLSLSSSISVSLPSGTAYDQSPEHNQHIDTATPTLSVSSPTASYASPASPSSTSKRQSIYVGDSSFGLDLVDGLTTTTSSPSSNMDNAGVDQDDMKEVQIETENPSHLFWVPFHLHPEIAPNEYNKWLVKHGVQADAPDGLLSTTRRGSVRRRKSVLSSQYNPEEDTDEPAVDQSQKRPETINEKEEEVSSTAASGGREENDFLSGVFNSPLAQMGEPPLKKMTSLRRSVSLSVQSPTRDEFPADIVEEDLAHVKRAGLGGQSLLRRSARTKIRRNSTASNDTRIDASRLRPVLSEGGEYQAVSLVDPGPLPLAGDDDDDRSAEQQHHATATSQERETKPLRRFVSTLRDPTKPTITTYVEPHLLEQQRKEAEKESKTGTASAEDQVTSPFRVSAPGQLENQSMPSSSPVQPTSESVSAAARQEQYTPSSRKVDPVSYPIPPPVKLPQNLLQKSSSTAQPPSPSQPSMKAAKPGKHQVGPGLSGPSHAKKPSTWSWLWGKEKEKEKMGERIHHQQSSAPNTTEAQQSASLRSSNTNTASTDDTQTSTPVEVSSTATATKTTTTMTTTASGTTTVVKKQSTFSMLFSRGTKSSSANQTHQPSTTESVQAVIPNGTSGQSVYGSPLPTTANNNKPRYTNYNRLPIHIERAIYRLSHVKLANPRRPLHEQVLISNMMFWYLGVIQQQQMLQQQQQELQQQMQMQQEAAEQQKQQQNGDNGKSKSKDKKTKKRKSQKKKNGQRVGAAKAEVAFKSPQYDVQQQEIISQQYTSQNVQVQKQQQQQNQQQQQQKSAHQYYNQQPSQQTNQQTWQQQQQQNHQGAAGSMVKAQDHQRRLSREQLDANDYDEESMVGGSYGENSDSLDELEDDRTVVPDSDGGMMSGHPVQDYGSVPATTILGHENDDDVPLAHYQHVQRQGVPVS